MAYLLDANVFIQAKNLHYGFDFCPAFWDWIDHAHSAGVVYSVDSVRTELIAGDDELADWAKEQSDGFFLTPDQVSVPSLQAVSIWASTSGYDAAAVSTFLQVADYYLVAQAHALHHTVVTHEIVSPSTRRIKIPNACIGLNVQYSTPFSMLRTERARFVITS